MYRGRSPQAKVRAVVGTRVGDFFDGEGQYQDPDQPVGKDQEQP